MAGLDQRLRDLEHAGHMRGGARELVGGQDVDAQLVAEELVGEALGDRARAEPRAERLGHHFVFAAIEELLAHVADIGHVLDVPHRVASREQQPTQPVGK